ncbi:MAG TPA: pseudouridine synthase [Candidatus Paceibacterota bacterium]|nr:pseudouridine synthase [Candidatus Paceibacterota bacterium]
MKPKRPSAKKVPKKAPELVAPAFPMRINQYLAWKGHSTRRGADELIKESKVFLNGKRAKIGDKVAESDIVDVRFRKPRAYAYLAFNKPVGMDTHAEGTGTDDVVGSLPADLKRLKLFPVGRLDKASRGLIIVTNDGRITDRLLNPAHAHEKTYEVTTKKPLRASFKEKAEAGVNIEGYVTAPAKVALLGESKFRITLTEGKTHQVRRMVAALFNEVADLKRVSIMNVSLGTLKAGGYRPIEGAELEKLLAALELA